MPRPIAGQRLLVGVMYLAAFAVTCAVLALFAPFPDVPLVSDKIEYLARHGDEYDVIFLGSSRVHCQIVPEIFDRIAAENGVTVKSFNAGINGMISPEDGYVLEEILRRPHRRLRWIILELQRLGTGLGREDTGRFGYWHDSARLVLVARRIWGEAREKLERNPAATFCDRCGIWYTTAGAICGHVRHGLLRAINFGRGSEALIDWLSLPDHKYVPAKELGTNHTGWLAMDRGRKAMSGDTLEEYQTTYADRLVRPAIKERGDPVSQSALERLLAAVAKSGASPVLIVPPTTAGSHFYPTEAREAELTILDFSDVRQYAGLFEPEHRLDVDHLNTPGAKVFSQILALRFAEIARRRERMP